MKNTLLWITLIMLCSCSKYKGDKNILDYDRIGIIFDGSGDYDTEGEINITITDSAIVRNLNQLKNKSSSNLFAALKATEYSIRLYFEDSETGEILLISISKSKDRIATIEYGTGTIFDGKYQNPELIQYLSQILKLDDLKNHKGKLTQAEYNNLILKNE